MAEISKKENGEKEINSQISNDIVLLHRMFPKTAYVVVQKQGEMKPIFIAECKLDESTVFYGEGTSKQKAKQDAASSALKFIRENKDFTLQPTKSLKNTVSTPKQPVNPSLQHVCMVVNNLQPNINFMWDEVDPHNIKGQVQFNGKFYFKEGSNKKNLKMLLCADILIDVYGPDCLEHIGDVIYLKENSVKQVKSKIDDSLTIPKICGNLHPTIFLNNIYNNLTYTEVNDPGPHESRNLIQVDVEGMIFTGEGKSKKIAKLNCAINAIVGLQQIGILEDKVRIARMNRMNNKRMKSQLYNKNKSLSHDPRIKNMISSRNFKFTNFQKSSTLLDPNQGITYPSNHASSTSPYPMIFKNQNHSEAHPYFPSPSATSHYFSHLQHTNYDFNYNNTNNLNNLNNFTNTNIQNNRLHDYYENIKSIQPNQGPLGW